MARKKVVFVIVEGPSDDEALGVLFSHIFDRNSVFVHIMHRDITSERGVRPDNILSRLGNEVRTYAKANHFTRKDFQEIIHITDMDGAYVADEHIVEDPSAKHPVYSTEEITTCSVEAIAARNGQKRQIWTSYAAAINCGASLIGYSICPAISIMYCTISSTAPTLKKKPMPTLLPCSTATISRRSEASSRIRISPFLPAIRTRGTLSNLERSL